MNDDGGFQVLRRRPSTEASTNDELAEELVLTQGQRSRGGVVLKARVVDEIDGDHGRLVVAVGEVLERERRWPDQIVALALVANGRILGVLRFRADGWDHDPGLAITEALRAAQALRDDGAW
jgi:hypothetical protein